MANLAVKLAALLVLTTFASFTQAHTKEEENNMLAQLQQMRNSISHNQASPAVRSTRQPLPVLPPAQTTQFPSQAQAPAAQAGMESPPPIAASYTEPEPETEITTGKPSFMDTASPKNRAVVTGVVAGAAVSAVAGGIAIAIEESKINKRRKQGLPPKPLFAWLAPKNAQGAAPSPPPALPPPKSHGSDDKRISARAKEETVAPTLPPTEAPTPPPTTTAAPLRDEIPLPVWIALAVLALCCLAALVCACVEALRHGSNKGKQKRSLKNRPQEHEVSRQLSRSDSGDFSEDGSYFSDDMYSERSMSYAQVAPVEQSEVDPYYGSPQVSPAASVQYSYDYSQQGSYQSSALLSQGYLTPATSTYEANTGDLSANTYAGYVNPHPNASGYVDPQTGIYHYSTNS